jgi:hypothetical protein
MIGYVPQTRLATTWIALHKLTSRVHNHNMARTTACSTVAATTTFNNDRCCVSSLKSANLYRLFRPEFLKLNPVPLSSDAFSQFGKDAISRVHNDEVREATRRLETECIPAFAAHLDRRAKISTSAEGANPFAQLHQSDDVLTESTGIAITASSKPILQEELSQLIADMHLHGINCRYLLLILRHVVVPYSRVLLITEVVARLCKNRIRAEWRLYVLSLSLSLSLCH